MKEVTGRYISEEGSWSDKDKERHVQRNLLILQFCVIIRVAVGLNISTMLCVDLYRSPLVGNEIYKG